MRYSGLEELGQRRSLPFIRAVYLNGVCDKPVQLGVEVVIREASSYLR